MTFALDALNDSEDGRGIGESSPHQRLVQGGHGRKRPLRRGRIDQPGLRRHRRASRPDRVHGRPMTFALDALNAAEREAFVAALVAQVRRGEVRHHSEDGRGIGESSPHQRLVQGGHRSRGRGPSRAVRPALRARRDPARPGLGPGAADRAPRSAAARSGITPRMAGASAKAARISASCRAVTVANRPLAGAGRCPRSRGRGPSRAVRPALRARRDPARTWVESRPFTPGRPGPSTDAARRWRRRWPISTRAAACPLRPRRRAPARHRHDHQPRRAHRRAAPVGRAAAGRVHPR
jgi:hypothetical protein